MNASMTFETNPYLILYSAKLKATRKLPDALLDPPQGESEIRARWADVDVQKNIHLATTDYERRVYNDKLPEVKAVLLDGGEVERRMAIEEAKKEIERRFLEILDHYCFNIERVVSRMVFERVAIAFKRWVTSETAEVWARLAGYRFKLDKQGREIPMVPEKPADWPDKFERECGVIDTKTPEYLCFLSEHEGRPIRDVYEFLKAGPTSPLATLQKGLQDAKGRYPTQNMSLVNKSPHLQAAASLFRVLDDVLKTEESRARWERCWELHRIDREFRPVFMTLLDGGKVRAADYRAAVEKCREAGLPEADAEYYVYEYFVLEKKAEIVP